MNAFHIMYQKVTSLGSFLKKEKKERKRRINKLGVGSKDRQREAL